MHVGFLLNFVIVKVSGVYLNVLNERTINCKPKLEYWTWTKRVELWFVLMSKFQKTGEEEKKGKVETNK